jgi:hypothetical protein
MLWGRGAATTERPSTGRRRSPRRIRAPAMPASGGVYMNTALYMSLKDHAEFYLVAPPCSASPRCRAVTAALRGGRRSGWCLCLHGAAAIHRVNANCPRTRVIASSQLPVEPGSLKPLTPTAPTHVDAFVRWST